MCASTPPRRTKPARSPYTRRTVSSVSQCSAVDGGCAAEIPHVRPCVRGTHSSGRVSGAFDRPIVLNELDHPIVVDFPLRGEWTVEQTPAHRIPSHGTDVLGMRYAYDFIRTDERKRSRVHPAGSLRWFLVGGRTRDCYGWGEPVHAASGGEVVDAIDGVPERQWVHPVRESWAALRTARAYMTGPPSIDQIRVAGNHVTVRTAEAFALYAHLAPGSVAVRSGRRVSVGDVLGRVGHTGNSTAPHLHFQLMDSADALSARGIPCAFAAYLVQREDGWEHVRDGIPQRLERVRSGP
jgi:Peptidase family M23